MEACANHCCQTSINTKVDEHVTCTYCRQPVYCSRKCQAIDWVKHDCPNTYEVDNIESTFFVPYHYEDLLCAEEIAELDMRDPIFESYSLRKVNADMTVEHRVQPALIEGFARGGFKEKRTDVLIGTTPVGRLSGTYTLSVMDASGKEMMVQGEVTRDMIYKDNVANEKARILAGGKDTDTSGNKYYRARQRGSALFSGMFRKQRDKYVFWPGVEQVYDQRFMMPRKGDVTVSLAVGDDRLFVAGTYMVRKSRSLTRALRRKLDGRLITKVRGVLDSTENLSVLMGQDNQGNRALLTVLRQPKSDFVQLIDVEFSAPRSAFREAAYSRDYSQVPATENDQALREASYENSKLTRTLSNPELQMTAHEMQFDCDPNDADALVGLAMGLELVCAAAPDDTQHLQDTLVTIHQFAREKMQNPDAVPSPYVAAAVTEAVEALHTEYASIDRETAGRWRKAFRARMGTGSLKRKVQKYTSQEEFQKALDAQMTKARQAQKNKQTGDSFLDNAYMIVSIAAQDTKKRESFVLDFDRDEWDMLRERAKEIKEERKARRK